MIRTRISLPKQTYEHLKSLAQEESKSVAQKIREVLGQRLKKRQLKKKRKHFLEALARLNFKGGPRDLSINHDKYLYSNNL